MGDRWSFPKQASAATYVWQPMIVSGTNLSMPHYQDAWQVNLITGVVSSTNIGNRIIPGSDTSQIQYNGDWRKDTLSVLSSDKKDASFTVRFKGKQVGIYGLSRPDGGYARITIQNSKGKIVLSSIIDLYCKYPVSGLKFLSPVLPTGQYTFFLSVMGERGNWSDKRKSIYGSSGCFVSLDKLVIRD